jgi:hypothetical protein
MSPLLIGALVLVLVLLVAYFVYNQGEQQSPKVPPKSLPTKSNATLVRQTSVNRPATPTPQPRNAPRAPVIVPRDDHTEQLYRNLLKKSLGDKAKVERLIQYEATRAPTANRAAWIQSAIERWERDNR